MSDIISFYNRDVSRVSVMTVSNIVSGESSNFHFNEWWNGEGFDLTIERGGDVIHVSLTSEEVMGLMKLFGDHVNSNE